jgi:hypothetical protein
VSVAVLNRWLNDLSHKADAIAGLERVIAMRPFTAAESAAIKAAAFSRSNPCPFLIPEGRAAMLAARPLRVDPDVWAKMLDRAFHVEPVGPGGRQALTSLSTCWALAGLFADGPKLYCPTLEEWEALARVELRVPLDLYRQPFPTVAVSIPAGAFGRASAALGTPSFVVVRHWRAEPPGLGGLVSGIIVGDNFASNYEIDFRFMWCDDGAETIESKLQAIAESSLEERYGDDAQRLAADAVLYKLQENEPEMVAKIKRAVLNACLLLSQHAPRLIGPVNPTHAAKLAASARKRLPPAVALAHAKALRLMPVVYGFHQHIRVVERVTEPEPDPAAAGTHPPKRPHWRRGHWLHQVFGKGRADRVLQFRPAKLVNEHLLSGPRAGTRVTMTTQ